MKKEKTYRGLTEDQMLKRGIAKDGRERGTSRGAQKKKPSKKK